MAIGVLPMLLESFATGTVMVVAGMAAWYLFKHDVIKKKTTQPRTGQPPVEASPISTLKKPTPEPSKVSESIPVMEEKVIEQLAEEPMLRRHYLNNIRQMLIAVTFPRPTDSALSRHYDEMIDAKAEECLEDEVKMARLEAEYEAWQLRSTALEKTNEEAVAEEPMLKRHYLNNIRQMLIAVTFPRPTDSALSRHYDEMIDAKAEECLESEAKMARLEAEYEALQNRQKTSGPTTFSSGGKLQANENPAGFKRSSIPEDSMLKRHYLSMIRAQIEAMKGPCPTDCTLRRHYTTMVSMEMDSYLATH